MANQAAAVTAKYLETQDLKFEVMGDNEEIIKLRFKMENCESVKVYIFFDDDSEACKLCAFDLTTFNENKKAIIYETCSKMNAQYRFVKFYVHESDNTLTADIDTAITLETCGPIVEDNLSRMVDIIDSAYPEFMKAIWK